MIGILVEKIADQKLSQFLKERIFDPLRLTNTKMCDLVRTENWASFYGTLPDRTHVRIPEGLIGVGTFTEGASGIVSTIDDMLCLYKAYLAALIDQFANGSNTTSNNPFVQCRTIFKGYSFLDPNPSQLLLEHTYGCGWVRSQLPGPLVVIGMNSTQTTMPIVLKGGASHLCIYHQGMMPGSVANVALIPDTETVVTVVANSSHLGDATDWSSQIILEEIFEAPKRNSYEEVAAGVAARILDHTPSVGRELEKNRRHGTRPSYPLSDYSGTFCSDRFSFRVEISVRNEYLAVSFMGVELEAYTLRHHHDDTWTWWMPYEESCKRGRFVHIFGPKYYLMSFEGTDRLLWQPMDVSAEIYVFMKEPNSTFE
jgi:hypothetical protein